MLIYNISSANLRSIEWLVLSNLRNLMLKFLRKVDLKKAAMEKLSRSKVQS